MTEPWEEIRDQTVAAFRDTLKGFIERTEVDEFAKKQSELLAREWWYAQQAGSDEERQEHQDNMLHLRAQIKGEFFRLQIEVSEDAKNTIVRVLEMAANVLIKVAPTIISAVAR